MGAGYQKKQPEQERQQQPEEMRTNTGTMMMAPTSMQPVSTYGQPMPVQPVTPAPAPPTAGGGAPSVDLRNMGGWAGSGAPQGPVKIPAPPGSDPYSTQQRQMTAQRPFRGAGNPYMGMRTGRMPNQNPNDSQLY